MSKKINYLWIIITGIVAFLIGCNNTENSREWQHSPEPPALHAVEMAREKSIDLESLSNVAPKADRTFSDQFIVSNLISLGSGSLAVGTYDLMPLYVDTSEIVLKNSNASGFGIPYLIWIDENGETQSYSFGLEYCYIEKILYDSESNQIYLLAIRQSHTTLSKSVFSYVLTCLDKGGDVKWEMPIDYMVADIALISYDDQISVAIVASSYQRTGILLTTRDDANQRSFDKMSRIYNDDGEECASAIFFFSSSGELIDKMYERENYISTVSGSRTYLFADCAWYESTEKSSRLDFSRMQTDDYHVGVVGYQSSSDGIRLYEADNGYKLLSGCVATEDYVYVGFYTNIYGKALQDHVVILNYMGEKVGELPVKRPRLFAVHTHPDRVYVLSSFATVVHQLEGLDFEEALSLEWQVGVSALQPWVLDENGEVNLYVSIVTNQGQGKNISLLKYRLSQ